MSAPNASFFKLLAVEFFMLFVLLPLSLAIDYPLIYKIILSLLGFAYILVVLYRSGLRPTRSVRLSWASFWRMVGLRFLVIAVLTIVFVYIKDASLLFYVPLHSPGLFGVILLVYALFSVWPQELIYRTFFFERYSKLFKDNRLLCFVNAIVFSLAHLFFRNTLVLVLTFLGGLLFGMTYLKYKSTLAVSIEHAIYGNWLFTVGMGEMLAFPGMES